MRFASHRDFQRALERAIRRAGVPMGSAGFSRTRRSLYANAAPRVQRAKASTTKSGLWLTSTRSAFGPRSTNPYRLVSTVDVVRAATPDFANRLEASVWRIALPVWQ